MYNLHELYSWLQDALRSQAETAQFVQQYYFDITNKTGERPGIPDLSDILEWDEESLMQ